MFLVHGFVLIGLLVVGSLRSWWSRLTTKVIQLSLLVSPLGFRHFFLYFSLARGHIKKKNKTARDNDGSEACKRVGWWCVHFRSNQGSSLGYFVMLFLSSRLQICAMYAYSSITESHMLSYFEMAQFQYWCPFLSPACINENVAQRFKKLFFIRFFSK